MSVTGTKVIGIPVMLLHDAEGGYVTIELKNGCTYHGLLDDAQDNFNCKLTDVTKTDEQGIDSKLEMVYVRGSQVRFICMPEMLSIAPYFQRIKFWQKYKGKGVYGGNPIARGLGASISQRTDQNRDQREGFGGRGGRGGRGGGGYGGMNQGPLGVGMPNMFGRPPPGGMGMPGMGPRGMMGMPGMPGMPPRGMNMPRPPPPPP